LHDLIFNKYTISIAFLQPPGLLAVTSVRIKTTRTDNFQLKFKPFKALSNKDPIIDVEELKPLNRSKINVMMCFDPEMGTTTCSR
jgi:hypothetical protein